MLNSAKLVQSYNCFRDIQPTPIPSVSGLWGRMCWRSSASWWAIESVFCICAKWASVILNCQLPSILNSWKVNTAEHLELFVFFSGDPYPGAEGTARGALWTEVSLKSTPLSSDFFISDKICKLYPRQEALSSAVSEKDAHLQWLEVTSCSCFFHANDCSNPYMSNSRWLERGSATLTPGEL